MAFSKPYSKGRRALYDRMSEFEKALMDGLEAMKVANACHQKPANVLQAMSGKYIYVEADPGDGRPVIVSVNFAVNKIVQNQKDIYLKVDKVDSNLSPGSIDTLNPQLIKKTNWVSGFAKVCPRNHNQGLVITINKADLVVGGKAPGEIKSSLRLAGDLKVQLDLNREGTNIVSNLQFRMGLIPYSQIVKLQIPKLDPSQQITCPNNSSEKEEGAPNQVPPGEE